MKLKVKDLKIHELLVFKINNVPRITIKTMYQKDGSILYSLNDGHLNYSKSKNDFVLQHISSNRTNKILKDTRFKSPKEALDAWYNFLKTAEDNHFLKVLVKKHK